MLCYLIERSFWIFSFCVLRLATLLGFGKIGIHHSSLINYLPKGRDMKTMIVMYSLLINAIIPVGFSRDNVRKVTVAPISSVEIFNSKWNYSPLIIKKEDESVIHTKIFKRILWIETKAVPVSELTFVYLKNPKPNEDKRKDELSYIAQSFKKSFGNKMVVKGSGNFFSVEGPFEKTNRYMRLSLVKKDDSITIITSATRIGFYSKLENELNELHAFLSSYKGIYKNKEAEVKTSWLNFIMNEAHADNDSRLDFLSLIGGSHSGRPGLDLNLNLNSQMPGVENGLNNLSGNVGNLNTTLGGTNQTWNNTNTQLGRANDTAAKFADEYKNMNTNWAESNKMIAQTTDPNHMAKVGFYTAAGAALGAVTMNLAIQGVSSGISFLYELFTGEKKKKLEWEDFEKAMQTWDTQLNDLVKLEQLVDNYIAAFDFLEGKGVGNDYVKQLQLTMRDMRFDRDLFMEKFKDKNLDISCRKMFYNAADELDMKLKDYDKIIQYISDNNLSISGGPAYFCNQLKDLQRKILTAENQMQDLRLKILVAENQFYEKQGSSLDKRDSDIEKVNESLTKTFAHKKEYDEKIQERILALHQETKAKWLGACVDGENDAGKKISNDLKETFFLFAHFKKRSRCDEAYKNVEEALKKRDLESVKKLAQEDEMRKALIVKPNTTVELKLSEEQMSWMSRVHMDAFCYQFSHQGEDKLPQKCKEYPEMLYSLSLSKGFEKAQAAYQNKCQDRYMNGLKRLSQHPSLAK